MDITLREWLILAAALIVGVILLDGFRRMRRAGTDEDVFRKGMGEIGSSPIDEDFNPELPNGGARIIGRDGDDVEQPIVNAPDQELDVESGIYAGPEYGADEQNDTDYMTAVRSVEKITRLPTRDEKVTFGEGLKASKSSSQSKRSNTDLNTEILNDQSTDKVEDVEPPQEVIVINVLSKRSEGFHGVELKELFELCGLIHGDMSIFHRHEEVDQQSPIQFSVANAVEPGYFDPANIQNLTTPGVCFFMGLPGPSNNMKAFDYMLETAQCLAKNLDGELKDERRSVLTQQTIAHCRQRIKDFERRQLSRR